MRDKRENRAAVIRKAIASIEQRLDKGELTPTIADLVRLLQIEKEIDDEQPLELKVTWVESAETEPAFKG